MATAVRREMIVGVVVAIVAQCSGPGVPRKGGAALRRDSCLEKVEN